MSSFSWSTTDSSGGSGGSGGGSIGSGLGALGSLVEAGSSLASTILNAQMAEKNYNLSKDQFKYQKWLQSEMLAREDKAVQRRVADLRAAGLSPVLAAGSAASSGPVVQTKAPRHEGYPDFGAPLMQALGLMKMTADISRTKAEEKYIEQQFRKSQAETGKIITEKEIRDIDLDIAKGTGLGSNPTDLGKYLKDIFGVSRSRVVQDAVDANQGS